MAKFEIQDSLRLLFRFRELIPQRHRVIDRRARGEILHLEKGAISISPSSFWKGFGARLAHAIASSSDFAG